jgi:DNA-directed RNA polymerase subunit RPC12/RpoP
VSDIKFECPHCSKHLIGDSALSGKTIPCADCGKKFTVTPTEPPIKLIVPGIKQNASQTKCPYCHAVSEINNDQVNKQGKCPSCGQEFKLFKFNSSPPPVPNSAQPVKIVSINIPFSELFALIFCSALAGAIIAFLPFIIISAATSR